MLTSLRRHASPTVDGPVAALLECHDRIRRFSATARRLAATPDAPRQDVLEVAAQLRHYFTVSLPQHSADEDLSLVPRLAAGATPEVTAALQTMSAQHVEIHALIDQLVPSWSILEREPGRLPDLAPAMAPLAARLEQLFGEHLAMEERVLFPAVARLDGAAQDAIRREVRARREGPAGSPRPGNES